MVLINYSGNFLNKSRKLGKIPDNAILVTADVVGLYSSVPHKVGIRALKEALDKPEQKKFSTEDFVQMAEFVLKNNFFEFNNQIKQQIFGTAVGTECAPMYACTAKNTVISPNFLVWKFCGKAQFLRAFSQNFHSR